MGNDEMQDEIESCPNPDCIWSDPEKIPRGLVWYKKHGYYASGQHGRIRRFVCINCGRTFSARTNKKEWYLHYDDISISLLAEAWLAGGSVKEIARNYGISRQMVVTRLMRSDDVDELSLLDKDDDLVLRVDEPDDPPDDPPKAS